MSYIHGKATLFRILDEGERIKAISCFWMLELNRENYLVRNGDQMHQSDEFFEVLSN